MQQAQREGLFAPARRALTIGLVLTVTLVAFEALAVVTILPVIKDDLGGLRLYGWVTSAFFLGTLVGIVVAGSESDRRGPGPPYVLGILLVAAGLVVGVRPLLRLLPAGTLRARQGLPTAVLSRGMLTFAFFGTDTYVPLAITAVRGRTPAMASLAVTAATLSWTLGAWLQERGARSLSSRFLVRTGLLVVVVGIAVMAVSLLHAVPVAISVVAWAIGGLGIGLAYA